MSSTTDTQQPLATGCEPTIASQKTTAMTSKDEPPVPTIRFSTMKNLLAAIREAKTTTGDAIQVEGVTPQIFAEILKKRPESEKFLVFFSEPRQIIMVTIPKWRHENSAERVSSRINESVWQMGLTESVANTRSELFSSAAGGQGTGPGEPDDSFTPIKPNGEPEPWPSVIIEVGDSQPIGDLRHKAAQWFLLSNYAVQVVMLVKIIAQSGTITIEKWKATDSAGRPGAMATRASMTRGREPEKVQEIRISRPGVGNGDDARLDSNSYVVVRAPLRLEFAELCLRQPGPGEHDIMFDDAWLRDMAVRVWMKVY